MEPKLVNYIINHLINMYDVLKKLNIDVKPNGVMFCPFHENVNTPSAHYYVEQDGSGCIFCFYEHKIFTNVDLFKTYCPDIDLNQLAEALFNRLSKEDQKRLKYNLESGSVVETIPYLDDLEEFKFSKINFNELLKRINLKFPIDTTMVVMTKLYELGDTLKDVDNKNKYMSFMGKENCGYKYLSSFKVFNSDFKFPEYIISYLSIHGDCIMIPNIIDDVIYSITLRNLSGKKQFLKIGNVSQFLYNLGNLPKEFHYGNTLLIVEGNFDCDYIKSMFPNTVACLTNALSNSQLDIISRLTNKVILAFDNDEAGDKGFYISKKKLEELGISVIRFKHNDSLKDFGDLYDLQFKDSNEYEYICRSYKLQLDNLK